MKLLAALLPHYMGHGSTHQSVELKYRVSHENASTQKSFTTLVIEVGGLKTDHD